MNLAIIRYAVVCQSWQQLTPGHTPYLPAFLAGWFMREIDAELPNVTTFRDSVRAGWTECDTMATINDREDKMRREAQIALEQENAKLRSIVTNACDAKLETEAL